MIKNPGGSRRWVEARAGVLLAAGLLAVGCGGGTNHKTTSSTTGATTTTAPAATTSTTTPAATTTTPPGPSFASITGTYVAGTADGGSVYIRSDGASRFLAPDGSACPTCNTASSPYRVDRLQPEVDLVDRTRAPT